MLAPKDWEYNRDSIIAHLETNGMMHEEDPKLCALLVTTILIRATKGHVNLGLMRWMVKDVYDTITLNRARAAFVRPTPPEVASVASPGPRSPRSASRRGRRSVDLKNRFTL